MKTLKKFTIYDFKARPTFGFTIGSKSRGASGTAAADVPSAAYPAAANRQSPIVNRKSQAGIALVITLIMLSVTLVMAVAFLALAKRERGSVSTATDTAVARLAAASAVANAQVQIVAGILSGFNGLDSTNAYNLHLLVSTNYINPLGFNPNGGTYGSPSPTNVNYDHLLNGNPLSQGQFVQNVANLWFLPRPPVMTTVDTGDPAGRFYLDLNENGRYDTNYYGPDFDANGNPLPGAYYLHTGDPEWIGVLEHPDAPHGPNNHFVSRYAFIAVPAGNALDINYLHNQALNPINPSLITSDGYFRNQGVGSWEINLAAFLADLNTNLNMWGESVGSGVSAPAASGGYYQYNEPSGQNRGHAFDDARALLAYRYYDTSLPSAANVFAAAPAVFPFSGIDDYSRGPLQTNVDYFLPPPIDTSVAWSGADNTNHYFTPGDFFDGSKLGNGLGTFTNRLRNAGTNADTYDRYTFYRMLDQLGSDSSPDDGRLNLNYCNVNTNFYNRRVGADFGVVTNAANVVPGMETNLLRWQPLDFFLAASDQMLRLYSSNWWSANSNAFINTFNVTAPFSITNIPVLVSNRFVYTPAVNRLLQLAANIYDATTNGNNNLPHAFRPLFRRTGVNNDIYIIGYAPVTPAVGAGISQLATPYDVTYLNGLTQAPIQDANGPVNVYGVPWIIGAKKGLPSFNQFYLTNAVQITRQMMFTSPNGRVNGPNPFMTGSPYTAYQRYLMGFNIGLGVSFWNPYTNAYNPLSGKLTVYANDLINTALTPSTNSGISWSTNCTFYLTNYSGSAGVSLGSWTNTQWYASTPPAVYNPGACTVNANWALTYPTPQGVYRFGSAYGSLFPQEFDPPGSSTYTAWETTIPALPQLPNFGMAMTNRLQAYILDGSNNVIDYVQLRDPSTVTNLGPAMADPPAANGGTYWLWSANSNANWNASLATSYGVYDQWAVSGGVRPGTAGPPLPPGAGPNGWASPKDFLPQSLVDIATTANLPMVEALFFNAFFTPTGFYNIYGVSGYNLQKSIQAAYTPTRVVEAAFLLQANDPMVHYLASDLNSQLGASTLWGNGASWPNGVWKHVDDLKNSLIPTPPPVPGNRYQPWGTTETAPNTAAAGGSGDLNGSNLAYKDPLCSASDNWDFPTNLYPTVGWLGRVHRGTPWQTVYLKSMDVLTNGSIPPNVGSNWWAGWTGDIQQDYKTGQFIEAARSAPVQDRLLFDIFTTRLNDNSVRGTLPVNAGTGRPDGGLADWSALFSGMVALSGTASAPTPQVINPAGVDAVDSPLWQIVNGPTNGINATRANMPFQSFTHVGQILATPALSTLSPFLSGSPANGVNDEMYEWLPQQMMGLVRGTEQRYVLYCYGQALRPAPNGTVLSGGPYFQLVTNYQVVAESVVRAVVRVDQANTSQPHAVVESYNVLPPN